MVPSIQIILVILDPLFHSGFFVNNVHSCFVPLKLSVVKLLHSSKIPLPISMHFFPIVILLRLVQ